MKKRVALINPPSPFLISQRVFPNLGIVQVATSLRTSGIGVDIIDLCGVNEPEKEIEKIIREYEAFGFSSTSPQFKETYSLHKLLKHKNPNAFTIIGGPHASAMASLRRKDPQRKDINFFTLEEFDVVFEGEADADPLSILEKTGPKWRQAPLLKDIASAPIPDRGLIDVHSYKYSINGDSATTLLSQRGCPFKCTFCSGRDIEMYRIVRSNSPERVLEELDYLNQKFGFMAFMWFDDEINVNPKRLIDLSKALQKRDYSHRGFVRSDLLVRFPDTLDALIDAGFVEL